MESGVLDVEVVVVEKKVSEEGDGKAGTIKIAPI